MARLTDTAKDFVRQYIDTYEQLKDQRYFNNPLYVAIGDDESIKTSVMLEVLRDAASAILILAHDIKRAERLERIYDLFSVDSENIVHKGFKMGKCKIQLQKKYNDSPRLTLFFDDYEIKNYFWSYNEDQEEVFQNLWRILQMIKDCKTCQEAKLLIEKNQ